MIVVQATFALSLLSNPGLGDREASGVRSGVIDLFPKDENRETEVIAASVSSDVVAGTGTWV